MKKLIILVIVVWLPAIVLSQSTVPPLERTVSIAVHDTPVNKLLDIISQKGNFSFSYNPAAFDTQKKLDLKYSRKTVRYLLNEIFKGNVTYKTRGNFIILNAVPKKSQPANAELKYVWVNGYTISSADSSKIRGASVLEEKSLRSVVTDEYGYFSIQLPMNTPTAQLNIKKAGFKDTALQVERGKFQSVEITLSEIPAPVQIMSPVVDTNKVVQTLSIDTSEQKTEDKKPVFDFLLNNHLKSNLRNIADTFFRKAQFSVVPGLSTNRMVGTRVINNFSFNMLAGYTYGVKGFELGGLLNINLGYMHGCQIAGLINTVGGDVKGAQIAGLVNVVKQDVRGAQIGGLVNVVGGKMYGWQIGGLVNYVHDTVIGVQIGGLVNTNRKPSSGFMLAGLANYSSGHNGSMVSGLYNHAKYANGSQIAGLFNYARTVKGTQIAGLINYAHNIKGSQIGVINIADSCSGATIGIFNFVKTGYHKIEISTDEVISVNLGFRSGTEKFHTLLGAGLVPSSAGNVLWTYTYGIGSSFKLVKTLWMDVDISVNTLNYRDHSDYLNLNHKFYTGLEWRFFSKLSISAGPTFNLYLTDTRNTGYAETFNTIRPSYLSNKRVGDFTDMKTWIGFKASIRFL